MVKRFGFTSQKCLYQYLSSSYSFQEKLNRRWGFVDAEAK